MSQVTYRANLSAKSFPFLSENWGRTIIVPQYDNTFSRQLTSQEDPDKDVGIPQVFYCHNVMPHSQGFQSIGFDTVLTGTQVGTNQFTEIHYIKDPASSKEVYIARDVDYDLWQWTGTGGWTSAAAGAGGLLTFATVNGITYIHDSANDWYYDFPTDALVAAVYTGLGAGPFVGICESAGYLIFYDLDTIYWSSTLSPLDFTPSLITGAGSLSIEVAKGQIVYAQTHDLGFIVYTAGNAVISVYTGNSRYPFSFREIVGSDGIEVERGGAVVASDANTTNQYAYTLSGLQAISSSQSKSIFPELTDFISGSLYEDYDYATSIFTSTALTVPMVKQVAMIANRYLVISYAQRNGEVGSTPTIYQYALIFDAVNLRWGKIKTPHVDCFQHEFGATARKSIGFLTHEGTITTINFSPRLLNSQGVLALGKYQFIRSRLLQLDEINIENIEQGSNFSIYDLVALDGKNAVATPVTQLSSTGQYRKYGSRAVGINHSLVCKGSFNLDSLVLTFNVHGKR